MKKALDYVSDYQLKSACKVTQMIFAVLETNVITSTLHTVLNW